MKDNYNLPTILEILAAGGQVACVACLVPHSLVAKGMRPKRRFFYRTDGYGIRRRLPVRLLVCRACGGLSFDGEKPSMTVAP